MKLEFQAKFLQHLNKKKKSEEGFTLIELLVVIIIIGILAAIALPSLLAQVNKGKQAEAKQNVGSMNRSQQAYFLENGFFATTVPSIGVGIKTQTVNYTYTLTPGATATAPLSVNNKGLANAAGAGGGPGGTLKSYVGINYTVPGDTNTGELLTVGLLCETVKVGVTGVADANAIPAASETPDSNTGVTCGDETKYKDLSGKANQAQ